MIEHRHVIFVLAVVKVAKRDVTAVRSLISSRKDTIHEIPILYRYDRPLARVYQIASKSIQQKVIHAIWLYNSDFYSV